MQQFSLWLATWESGPLSVAHFFMFAFFTRRVDETHNTIIRHLGGTAWTLFIYRLARTLHSTNAATRQKPSQKKPGHRGPHRPLHYFSIASKPLLTNVHAHAVLLSWFGFQLIVLIVNVSSFQILFLDICPQIKRAKPRWRSKPDNKTRQLDVQTTWQSTANYQCTPNNDSRQSMDAAKNYQSTKNQRWRKWITTHVK